MNTSAEAIIGADGPNPYLIENAVLGSGSSVTIGGRIHSIADGTVETGALTTSATAGAFVDDQLPDDGVASQAEAMATAGDILIEAEGAIAIQGDGQLRVETSGTTNANNAGNAGNVIINAPTVTVQDDILISARTTGNGDGGNLAITAPTALNRQS